jgi:long-chain acyl-CoA synthetase
MSVVDLLLRRGAPAAPALVAELRTVDYGELAEMAARLGGELVERGCEPGDRVAIGAGNDVPFVAAYLAALHVGAIAVPLNASAPPSELGRELAAVAPRLVLAAGPAAPTLSAAGADVVTVDVDALDASPCARVDRAPDDVAVLLFTSGTAGAPKAAMLTHGNLASNIAQVQDHAGLRLTPDDRALGVLPFHHVFGLNVALGVTLAAGGAVVLEEDFHAAESVARIRGESVTVVAGVPTMYASWLALDDVAAPTDAFASVRLAVSGAAQLPDENAASFHRRYGVVVHQGYGLTEAAPIVTTTAVDDREPRAGSIGPPLPGVEVRLVDADGTDVLAGDPGEVWVRGPNVFPGYWHDQEATTRVLTDDGWLRTGDIAVVEDDELRLVDRAKDLIIVSGFNVYPIEVEDVLRADDDVRDVAVVGEPHPRTGETVVAYVVPEPGHAVDPEELRAVCARSLARYKCPSRIEVVAELPRSIAGKLVRRELREQE